MQTHFYFKNNYISTFYTFAVKIFWGWHFLVEHQSYKKQQWINVYWSIPSDGQWSHLASCQWWLSIIHYSVESTCQLSTHLLFLINDLTQSTSQLSTNPLVDISDSTWGIHQLLRPCRFPSKIQHKAPVSYPRTCCFPSMIQHKAPIGNPHLQLHLNDSTRGTCQLSTHLPFPINDSTWGTCQLSTHPLLAHQWFNMRHLSAIHAPAVSPSMIQHEASVSYPRTCC